MNELEKYLKKASNYCAKRECSKADLLVKFKQWQVPENYYSDILDYLQKNGFLNEYRFVESFVNDKIKFNKWGKLYIKKHLLSKNIDESLIDKALSSVDQHLYEQNAKKLISTKFKSLKGLDMAMLKQKILIFMLNKGYEKDLILKLISDLKHE